METPLGLTYRPFFPIAQSIFRQAEQRQQLASKALAEQTKSAETRAYQAVADLAKFHPDRPYVHSLEGYFQTQAKMTLDLMAGVRKREIPPDAVYDHMIKVQADADKAKRYDAEITTHMGKWKDSGNYDMQYVTQKYANHTVDLQATAELGTVAWLPPSATDANVFVNDVLIDIRSFNPTTLSQKFIADLERTHKEQQAEYDPAGNVTGKDTGLPDFFMAQLGSSGQHILNMGPVDSDQSKVLLNRFRGLGPDWDNYLQLRAANENPEFVNMKPGSDEWGRQMQKSLQSTMADHGFVGKIHTEVAKPPPSEADKTGTRYDRTKIGYSQKAEDAAFAGADVLYRLMNGDQSALSFFKGPNVKTARFSANGKKMMIEMKEGKVDQLAGLLSQIKGAKQGESPNQAWIPLTREALVQLVNYKNSVSSREDWIGEHIEQAFDRKYPGGGPVSQAAPTEDPIEKKNREVREAFGVTTGRQTTEIKSHEEALKKLKPGDRYIINGVEYELE